MVNNVYDVGGNSSEGDRTIVFILTATRASNPSDRKMVQ